MPKKERLRKISVLGCGNWATVISAIVGRNVLDLPRYDNTVLMYAMDRMEDGTYLSEIINEKHENTKYLPGFDIPENVVAVPDLVETAADADIIIFCLPSTYIRAICTKLQKRIKPTALGLSLVKGIEQDSLGTIELISHVISSTLLIKVAVLMGGTLATEVAKGQLCEATIACRDTRLAPVLKEILQCSYVKIHVVDDENAAEICGALNLVISCGVGFCIGLDLGENTKASVVRRGLSEIIKFIDMFYPGSKLSTVVNSCGIGDLVVSFHAGRNQNVCAAHARTGKPIRTLENEMLKGQKVQGPYTAELINYMLVKKEVEDKFPLFTMIYNICVGNNDPMDIVTCLKTSPQNVHVPKNLSY